MEIFEIADAFQELALWRGQYGLLLHFPDDAITEEVFDENLNLKAAPFINIDKHGQAISDGCVMLFFNTKGDMEQCYWLTVGDDGPTKLNSYDGPYRIHALTCDKDGTLLNENT